MILVTKHNVTAELLESICSGGFLLQTQLGVLKFRLLRTTNTSGKFLGSEGLLVARGQEPYLVFSDDMDILLHGDVTELVEYIKTENYKVDTSEA